MNLLHDAIRAATRMLEVLPGSGLRASLLHLNRRPGAAPRAS
jgi:hypothetical protein